MSVIEERLEKINDYIDSLVDYNEVLDNINSQRKDASSNVFYNVIEHDLKDIEFKCFLYKFKSNEYQTINHIELHHNSGYINFCIPSVDCCGSEFILSDYNIYKSNPLNHSTSILELEEILLFEMKVLYGNAYNETILLFLYKLHKKFMNIIPTNHELVFEFRSKNINAKPLITMLENF